MPIQWPSQTALGVCKIWDSSARSYNYGAALGETTGWKPLSYPWSNLPEVLKVKNTRLINRLDYQQLLLIPQPSSGFAGSNSGPANQHLLEHCVDTDIKFTLFGWRIGQIKKLENDICPICTNLVITLAVDGHKWRYVARRRLIEMIHWWPRLLQGDGSFRHWIWKLQGICHTFKSRKQQLLLTKHFRIALVSF